MQLILLSKERGHLGQLRLDSGRAWLRRVCRSRSSSARGVFYGGFKAAALFGISNPRAQVDTWRAELTQQQSIVDSDAARACSRISTRSRCASAK